MSAVARDGEDEGPASIDTFLATLIPTSCVGIAVFSIYILARKRMPEVYEGKRKRLELEGDKTSLFNDVEDLEVEEEEACNRKRKKGHRGIPEALPAGIGSWVSLIWGFSNDDLLSYLGTDGLMYVRFLKLCFSLTFYMTIFGIAVLLPVNMSGLEGLTEFAQFTASNIEASSNLFFIHFLSLLLFSGLVMYKLYQEYCCFTQYRQQYLAKPTPTNYSILIRDIPKSITATQFVENVKKFYEKSGDLVSVTALTDRKEWDKLETKRCELIMKLDRAEHYYNQKGTRPTHKINGVCFNLMNAACVDSIEYYQEQLDQVQEDMQELARKKGKFLHSGIVSFSSIYAATSFKSIPIIDYTTTVTNNSESNSDSGNIQERQQEQQQEQEREETSTATTTRKTMPIISMFSYNIYSITPSPSDLLVNNTGATFTTRKIARIISNIAVLLFISFFFIIVSFIVALVDLTSLAQQYSWINDVLSALPVTIVSLIQGLLPVIILSVILFLIPPIMKFLATWQFLPSDTQCENSAIMRVYVFNVINSFLVVSIGGSLLSSMHDVLDNPASIFTLLATTLPEQASFFINFIMLAGLSNLPMEIARLPKLIMVPLLKRLLHGTGDIEKISRWDALSLLYEFRGFHVIYPFPMLIFLAAICFSSIAPLILPFATLYFAFAVIVWTNQLVYVYTIDKDSGGSQFPIIFNCMMTCLFLYQALFIGVMGLKKMPTLATLSLVVLLLSIYFCYLVNKNFKAALIKNIHAVEYSQSLHGGYVELTEEGRQQLIHAYGPSGANIGSDSFSSELNPSLSSKLTNPYGVNDYHTLDHVEVEVLGKGNKRKRKELGNFEIHDLNENEEAVKEEKI